MRLWIAIPTMNQGLLANALQTANEMSEFDLCILVHANGNPLDWADPKLREATDAAQGVYQTYSPKNIGLPASLHELYELHKVVANADDADDLICYLHDDVLIQEHDWDGQLVDFFAQHPEIGLVGFYGAKRLGVPDIYKIPFRFPAVKEDIRQLGRYDCYSNMQDALSHGQRRTSPLRVATVDGFSMVCRRRFLDQIHGWTWWPKHLPHHSYDNGLACMAARYGWQTWMYPLSCHHMGGQTATRIDFRTDFGIPEGEIHEAGHLYLYEAFRDVLPIEV